MALALTTDQRNALAKGHVKRRLFLWVEALDSEGEPAPAGLWDGMGPITIGPRTYLGGGAFVSISNVVGTSDLTVPGIEVTLSGVSDEAVGLTRGYVIEQRPIEMLMGIYDTATNDILPPLIRRFKGFIDDVLVSTPEVGGPSTITFMCESVSREMNISSTDTRSQASQQKLRKSDDTFFKYTAAQYARSIYFGRPGPRTPATFKGGMDALVYIAQQKNLFGKK